MFRLEAVFAYEGDCLLLHYGPVNPHPKWILIDGGAAGTWNGYLKKRLKRLKTVFGKPVPLGMVMVSHVDSDHISGVLDLFKHLKEPGTEKLCRVGQLWHNSFDDIIGNDDEELVSKLIAGDDVDADDAGLGAVVASVRQGRNLRNDAEALGMATNRPFTGLVRALGGPPEAIDQGAGLTFKVLAPDQVRLEKYQKKWNAYLKEKQLAEVEAASFEDKSAYNLASIVVLAEKGGKTMLLTGDARGDDTVNAMVEAGMLGAEAAYPVRKKGGSKKKWAQAVADADARDVTPFPVDLLKVPHHGSDRNVTTGFFKRLPAKHYLMSANGKHHNPDRPTLDMIAAARGDAEYTIHFTFTADQHAKETNTKYAEALGEVDYWIKHDKPAGCTVMHRPPGDDVHSISIDLED